MTVKVKPVQPTVIRDKVTIQKVINEIRRTPSSEKLAELNREHNLIARMIRG